jgi:hypothetical protein
MYQNSMYTEFLFALSGIRRRDLARVAYREKAPHQPVANYAFRAYGREAASGSPVYYRGAPHRLGRNAHFRLDCCNRCMDVFAETADAAFMDAWLPEYRDDKEGVSLVITRSSAVLNLLEDGRNESSLVIREITSDHAARSQAGHVRRKQHLICMRVPGTPLRPGGNPVRFSDRLDWFLQESTQTYSRRVWASVGRKYGPRAYWLAMGPLVLPALLLALCVRLGSLPARFWKRLRLRPVPE